MANKEERVVCCIGDIHGHISKLQNIWSNLETLINSQAFQKALIIFLGDYCDRGPNTSKVLDFLISLPSRYPNQTHVFLCGNHDFAFAAFLNVLPSPPDGSAFSETWKEFDQHEEREGWFKGVGYEEMHLQGRRWAGSVKVKSMDVKGSIYDARPTFESYGLPHGSAGITLWWLYTISHFVLKMKWLLIQLVALLLLLKLLKKPRRVRQKLCVSARSGKDYTNELLEGPSIQMFDLLRMDKRTFKILCRLFRSKGLLNDSKHVDMEEKMAMFLMTIGHNCRNRFLIWKFQHSGETISKYFHEVLNAMIRWSEEMVVPPATLFNRPTEIRSHRRLREGAFKGAIGALDGTLISASIPIDKQIPFRGRGQGQCFQNVMAICDFDMKFIYVVAGWEGVAHDSRVLNEALRDPAFKFPVPPPNMYYLCDAAYTHTRGFMCPYRNTRYWQQDFRRGGRARGKEEIFNHAHAQLRNVIERTYGVLKARFPILKKMPPYSFETQRDIVIACMTVHNFLRRVTLNDPLFQLYEDDDRVRVPNMTADDLENMELPQNINNVFGPLEQAAMVNLRDQIATELLFNH